MDTEIVNLALIKMGEPPVSSSNQNPLGKTLEIIYNNCRTLLLSAYPWKFAIKRVILSPLDEETMSARFKYKYLLPSDCLLLLNVGDFFKPSDLRSIRLSPGTMYEIEGKNILFKEKVLPLKYIANIEDSTFYPPSFKEALANKIAAELSIKVHQNANLYSLLEQKYMLAIQQAQINNEIQSDTEELPDNSWLEIRYGWSNEY